jgi:hypothetical protein
MARLHNAWPDMRPTAVAFGQTGPRTIPFKAALAGRCAISAAFHLLRRNQLLRLVRRGVLAESLRTLFEATQ